MDFSLLCLRFIGEQRVRSCSLAHNEWPMGSKLLCSHCCHAFTGQPIPAVTDYDARRDSFRLRKQCFCGWSCAKAFQMYEDPSVACEHLYRSITNTSFTVVRPAPPRTRLRTFGGDLTIDQFRQGTEETICVRLPSGVLMTSVLNGRKLEAVDRSYRDLTALRHRRKPQSHSHDITAMMRRQ